MTEVKDEIEFIANLVERDDVLLISVLEDIQEHYHYLPEKALRVVSQKLKMPLRDIYGVATFYSAFSLTPKGNHIITVCLGTACHVRGGARIMDALSNELNIKAGETTPDKKFSLEAVNCLGCCAIGPVVLLDGTYYGEMTPQKTLKAIKKLKGGNKK